MTSAMFAKVAGSWQKVYPPAPPVEQYNEATGGTVTEYTATDGKRMRVHTFLAESTLTVTKEVKPFRVLCVGAGGGGHLYEGPNTGNAGGGGEVKDAEVSIPLGNHAITVGGGGYQGSGGPSSVGSIATAAGGERAYNSRGGYWATATGAAHLPETKGREAVALVAPVLILVATLEAPAFRRISREQRKPLE